MNTQKTDREKAIEWWRNLGDNIGDIADKHHKGCKTITGREIEQIWRKETQQRTNEEKDFTVFDTEQKINHFLVSKLKQITDYISEPEDEGFFVEVHKSMTGQLAMQFICMANVFKYEIIFNSIQNKNIVYFNKI